MSNIFTKQLVSPIIGRNKASVFVPPPLLTVFESTDFGGSVNYKSILTPYSPFALHAPHPALPVAKCSENPTVLDRANRDYNPVMKTSEFLVLALAY